ncbi:hypothetical protein RFI_36185, partial [Reticulomyxa filosa]
RDIQKRVNFFDDHEKKKCYFHIFAFINKSKILVHVRLIACKSYWIQKLDYLPLLQLQLQVYNKAKPRKDYLKQVVALADELIGQINTTEVAAAAFFGRKAMEKDDSE